MTPLPTVLFVLSLIGFMLGERWLGSASPTPRIVVDVVAGLLLVASAVLRARQAPGHAEIPKEVRSWTSRFLGGVIAGLALYFLRLPVITDALSLSPETLKTFKAVLGVGWVLLLGICAIALLFVDASILAARRSPAIEFRRVKGAAQSGLAIGLIVALFGIVNYTVDAQMVDKDFSRQKLGQPSGAVLEIVENLDEPIYVTTFFPAANEVFSEIEPYLRALERTGNVVLLTYDHAFAPQVAGSLNVRDNGSVVFSSKDPRGEDDTPKGRPGHPKVRIPAENFRLGTDRQRARNNLKKFDSEVQKHILKVSRGDKRVYFTVGHGERDYRGTPRDTDDQRGRLRLLNQYLKSQAYQLRQLGAADGLVNEVPKGAAAVVIAGPTDPFLDAEIDALIKYFDEGGRIFVFLDPTNGVNPDGAPGVPTRLLEHLGVDFDATLACNPRTHAATPVRAPKENCWLVTKRSSSHASVTGIARGNKTLAVPDTGSLTKHKDTAQNVQFTLKSMSGTFKDLNGNFVLDKGTDEKSGQFDFAAAIEGKAAVPAPLKPDAEKKPAAKDKKGRAIVVGSTDVIADQWLRFEGNITMADNGFKWLIGEEEIAVAVKEIAGEDVPVSHTAGAFKFWFFATIFLMPALVLGGGFFFVRRSQSGENR